MEVSDAEVLQALKKVLDGGTGYVYLDGHELSRKPFIREATHIAVERGWLDLGKLIEGDQWSWYNAKITEAGKKAIRNL